MNNSPLTGEYCRLFEKYTKQSGNALCIPRYSIMPFVGELVELIAHELDSLHLCNIAHYLGIKKIVHNSEVDLLAPNEYGALLFGQNLGAVIVIDDTMTAQERRFTLAHEIGHYILHLRRTGREIGGISAARMEHEADMFAGALIYFIERIKAKEAA